MSDIYRIPVEKFELLQVELAKLNRRSAKCGTSGFELVIHGTDVEPVGNGEVRVFYNASIAGEAPKIAGYTFVARLDHNTDATGASNLVYTMPGEIITAEQRSLPANCEHCGWKRFRRDTYLLRNDATGEIIQVGRTCIKDFIGHDPNQMLKYASYLRTAIEHVQNASQYDFQMNNWRTVEIGHFLKYVALSIRTWGWVSGKEAYDYGTRSTKADAWNIMTDTTEQFKREGVVVNEDDEKKAAEALAWAVKQDKTSSDFMHNMVTLAETGYIDYKSAGVAAAIIQVHQKALEREAQQKLDFTKSTHQGNKGDRLTIEVTVYGKSYGNGSYGPWTRVSMIDAAGNVYVTFAGGKFDPAKGAKVKIRGTVKDHGEFKSVKQTNLNRVMELA